MKPSDLISIPVADMVSDAKVFSSTDKASVLIGHMRETDTYDAFVEEESSTSVVTVRDLLAVTDLDTRLSKVMHQVPRLNVINTVGDAASLMFEYRARSMPVYKGNKFLGAVTSHAIVDRTLDVDLKVKLTSIMTPSPVTLEPSSPVSTARELMRRKKFDQIPVVEGSSLRRVVTSAEIVFNLIPKVDRDQKGERPKPWVDGPVGTFGDDVVMTSQATDSLQDVFGQMKKMSKNYSVILNAGQVQGIITYRDFMKLLVRGGVTPAVPMYIVGLPEDSYSATLVRQKFTETVQLLRKVFPEINEARAVIELEGNNPQKKKNLVKVMILSPKERYSYEVFSYDLGRSFEDVHEWAKKLVVKNKPDRRRKTQGRSFPE